MHIGWRGGRANLCRHRIGWWLVFGLAAGLLGCSAGQEPVLRRSMPAPLVLPAPRPAPDAGRVRPLHFEQNYLTLVAGGDVMIGHWTLQYLAERGPDYPFRGIAPILADADIAFANLEAPFADSGLAAEKSFVFKVPTRYGEALAASGFTALSLANNHIMDFGADGLRQTLQALARSGLAYSGAGLDVQQAWQPAILHTPAGTVALVAFSMTLPREFWATDSTAGTAYPYEPQLIAFLDSLQQEVDFIVTSFHWGTEKKMTPNDYQIYFAHLAIDHGADLVLGHHPHVLQGVEIYKNRLIAYSLGNLAFSSYSSVAVNSMLLKIVLHREGLLLAKVIPLNVDNRFVEFQPQPAFGAQARAVITAVDTLSLPLNGFDAVEDSGYIFGTFPLRAAPAGRDSLRAPTPAPAARMTNF